MAARCDWMPQPELCISLAEVLGVACKRKNDLELSSLGRLLLEAASWPPHDRLNRSQLELISPEVLGHPELVDTVISVLRLMKWTLDSSRIYQLGSTRLSQEQSIAFQLLQATGFTVVNSDYISISKERFSVLSSLLGGVPTRSEEDLWQSLKEANQRARAAEEYVVEYERRRLSRAGRSDLSQLVERVSEYDVYAGFDVRSFEIDGATRYIEIKSSTNLHVQFYWSCAERGFGREQGRAYWIYFVPRSQELPDLRHSLVLIQDPHAFIGTRLSEEVSTYKVTLIDQVNGIQPSGVGLENATVISMDTIIPT